MFHFTKRLILPLATAAMAVLPLRAAEQCDSLSAHLGEVLVTAPRSTSVIAPQMLSGAQLEKLNSHSVADALRYFAGVQLKDYGGVGGIKTVNIRSMGTNHVGVFYDGVQLSNAQNGQIDLGQYSLDNMQSISLFNGQKSQIFQSAKDFANAGSIYLWTRTPEFDEGKALNLRAKVKTGSFNLINPSLLVELRLSDRISANVSTEWLNSDGHYKFRYRRRAAGTHTIVWDTTAVRQNGDVQALRLEGGLFGKIVRGKWMAKAYHYNSDRGVPGAIVNNVWRRGERIADNNTFVQGMLEKDWGERFHSKAIAKWAHYRTHYQNHDTTTMIVDNTYRQDEFYLSTVHMADLNSWWKLSAAYDLQWNTMDANTTYFVEPTRWTHMASLASSMSLAALRLQGSVVYNHVHDILAAADSPSDKDTWSPAVFARLKPWWDVDFSIRAYAKKSFRMPTFNDLYYTEVGNALLKPEHTTQWDLGAAFNTRHNPDATLVDLGVEADAYYNTVRNKIVAYPKGAQFRWTMLNLGKVHITGVDARLNLTLQPLRGLLLTTRLQYTYQKAIDVTSPTDSYYRHQIPYIPWHSGSATLQLDYRSWNVNYSFIYTGERYNQQENILYNHCEPWYTSDLSASKSFAWRGQKARVMLEVNNLLSQDYDVILNYPMPKRNYRITLTFEL